MPEINDLILEKLDRYPEDVRKLAKNALDLSERGVLETQMVEQLQSVVRNLIRKENTE